MRDDNLPFIAYAPWGRGWRVCAPDVPGCVVLHWNLAHALVLVGDAAEAAEDEGLVIRRPT